MRFNRAAFLVLLGALALFMVASPAGAQTSSDSPGADCVHPVGISEIGTTPASPLTISLWSAISFAVRQQIALGFMRWLPSSADPSAMHVNPSLLAPRSMWARMGGWSRP